MCLACVEFQMGKLSAEEAARNFGEINDVENLHPDDEHMDKFFKMLIDKFIDDGTFDETQN